MTDEGRVRRALNGDSSLLVTRAVPLDDIHIQPGGDGRTVVAYAATFMDPAEVHDQDGDYFEQNAHGAFDQTLSQRAGQIFCVYNHARTLHGTPSDVHSVPLGVPLEIRPDKKGLLTVTRYNRGDYCEQILEAIKNGALRGMSYTGVFLRSDPQLRPFQKYRADADGNLPLVTRLEIAMVEYGPTPVPVYQNAQVVGVRSKEGVMSGQPHERAGGPQPYEREPGENVLCPACGKYNMPDAVYCDQCGFALPASAYPDGQQAYERHPGEDVQCPNCLRYNDADAIYCDQCGQALPASAYPPLPAEETPPGGMPVSSSGRNPDDGRERAIAAICGHFGWPREEAERLDDQAIEALAGTIEAAHGSERAAAVDDSPWDADKVWHAGAESDNPAAFYRAVCAGRREGDPKTQQAWALPHHYAPGRPPNKSGVVAALQRFDQTEGLINKEQAHAHLEAHDRQIQAAEKAEGSSSRSDDTGGSQDAAGQADESARSATADTATGRVTHGADQSGPHSHSAVNLQGKKGTGTMPETPLTVEERSARLDEIGNRLREIDTEFAGAALTDQARAEWDSLLAEREEHKRSIADATARAQTLMALAEQQGGGVPGTDPGSGYDDAQADERGRSAGMDGQDSGQRVRTTRWGANIARRPGNIYDLTSIRQQARSVDDLPGLYRDRARWALEEAHFPGEAYLGRSARSREDIQGSIEDLMMRADDVNGTLARRILLTGSPTYLRAFGKMIKSLNTAGLTGEESRALAMGTPAAWDPGSYPVPYQIDPTVTLTSNGAINPLRQIARVEQIVGKEWLGVTSPGITVTRTAEATEATDAAPTLTQPGVAPERVQAFVPFSVEVEQDWNGLLAEIAMMLADAKDIEESSAFVNGDGTGTNAGGIVGTLAVGQHVATKTASVVTVPDDLDALESAMPPRFRVRASFIAAKAVFGAIRAAAVAAGDQFDVWARLGSGTPPELIGYSAYEASDMSTDMATTPGTVPYLVMGDFKQFIIVDRIGMSIELVPHLFGAANRLPTGQRGIYALWRNNSAILAQNAFRGLVSK